MKKRISGMIAVGSALSCILLAGCGSSGRGDSPSASADTSVQTPTTASTSDGAALYAADCAACHGALASSNKSGASVARIRAGIAGVKSMSFLSSLTPDQVQAIATVLAPASTPVATPTPAPTQTPTQTPAFDASAYYSANCAGCHGALASSQKSGATAARIQAGIVNVRSMNSFSSLTPLQIQAIATALTSVSTPVPTPAPVTTPAPAPTPTPAPAFNAAAYYTANCAGCHGALASSDKRGATAARIQAGIAGVRSMNSFSSLTAAQIAALAAALL